MKFRTKIPEWSPRYKNPEWSPRKSSKRLRIENGRRPARIGPQPQRGYQVIHGQPGETMLGFLGGAGDMRGQQHVGKSFQTGMDGRLPFKNVQSRTGYL